MVFLSDLMALFNHQLLSLKPKTHELFASKALYTDDYIFVALRVRDLQDFLDQFADACNSFGLAISFGLTEVMSQRSAVPVLHLA